MGIPRQKSVVNFHSLFDTLPLSPVVQLPQQIQEEIGVAPQTKRLNSISLFINVVRTVPLLPNFSDFALDRVKEARWSHLSLVYDCFNALISNRKFNGMLYKRNLTKLISGIIPLFSSPD